MTAGYEVFIVASKASAEKGIGTHTTTLVEKCSRSSPGLYFCSEEDARAFHEQLSAELRECFKIYRGVISINKEPV